METRQSSGRLICFEIKPLCGVLTVEGLDSDGTAVRRRNFTAFITEDTESVEDKASVEPAGAPGMCKNE
jgi:hypothetical protein